MPFVELTRRYVVGGGSLFTRGERIYIDNPDEAQRLVALRAAVIVTGLDQPVKDKMVQDAPAKKSKRVRRRPH